MSCAEEQKMIRTFHARLSLKKNRKNALVTHKHRSRTRNSKAIQLDK